MAVAHKMNRRWIGIELGDHAYTLCKPRIDKVIEGTHIDFEKLMPFLQSDKYREKYEIIGLTYNEVLLVDPSFAITADDYNRY